MNAPSHFRLLFDDILGRPYHYSSADPKERRGAGSDRGDMNDRNGGGSGMRGGGFGGGHDDMNHHNQANQPMNQQMERSQNQGQGMPNPMGFNMGNFGMNPAMAMMQSMFGMPQGMMGFNNQGGPGFNNQQPGYGNFNPGYGGQGFNNQGGNPSQQPQGGNNPAQFPSMWGASSPNGAGGGATPDAKHDLKGTAGWRDSASNQKTDNMGSWNQL